MLKSVKKIAKNGLDKFRKRQEEKAMNRFRVLIGSHHAVEIYKKKHPPESYTIIKEVGYIRSTNLKEVTNKTLKKQILIENDILKERENV